MVTTDHAEALRLIAKRCDEAGIVFEGHEAGSLFRRLRDFALEALTPLTQEAIDLDAHCRGLVLSVAALDDAGLTVEHKSAIRRARELRKALGQRRA